jgi:gas vesicle protein
MTSDPRTELKHRVEARRAALESRLHELAAESSATAKDTSKQISERLDSLKKEISDGWDDLGDAAAERLNHWLRDTESHAKTAASGH